MEKKSISERDLVFFVLSGKKKFPAEKLEKEVYKASKDFSIPERKNHRSYIREVIEELVSIGLLNEIDEKSGKERNKYYNLTKGGEKVYHHIFLKLMKNADDNLHRRLDEFFQYIIYEQ